MRRSPTHATSLAGLLLLGLLAGCGAQSKPTATAASARVTTTTARTVAPSHPVSVRLRIVATRQLPAPVQLPAVAVAGGRVLAAGGLSAQDTSVADVVAVAGAGTPAARRVGTLPQALHDIGAASLGGRMLLFGGGSANGATAAVLSVAPTGVVGTAAHLPVGISDSAGAAIGASAYVVGGYTDTVPLRSVLAYTAGQPALRDVAKLPHPLRYAAVAAIGGQLLVAGGTDGVDARREIVRVDVASGRARVIGLLPQPLEHAAGAALDGTFYVFGGRGDALGSQRRAIFAIDPASGRVQVAGALPRALSDLGAATLGGSIWLVGGRDASGGVASSAWELTR